MAETSTIVVPNNEGNNNMLPFAMMANGGMNGMNNWWPIMMLYPWLFAGMNGGFGGGFGGYENNLYGPLAGANTALNATTQVGVDNLATQVQGLSNQINNNQSFNQLNQGISNVGNSINGLNGAMVGGFTNIAQDINGVSKSIYIQPG